MVFQEGQFYTKEESVSEGKSTISLEEISAYRFSTSKIRIHFDL